MNKVRVGDTVRLDFKVTRKQGNILVLECPNYDPYGKVLTNGNHCYGIFSNNPLIQHIPQPRTVEVGQKYKSLKGTITFKVLFVDGATAFMSYDYEEYPSARAWELIKNLLDEKMYELIND